MTNLPFRLVDTQGGLQDDAPHALRRTAKDCSAARDNQVRSDNGSQFIATVVEPRMEYLRIHNEFIYHSTPDENAHFESFHYIMHHAIIRTMESESLGHLRQTLEQFRQLYNHKR
jgi:transposase InsO family protein